MTVHQQRVHVTKDGRTLAVRTLTVQEIQTVITEAHVLTVLTRLYACKSLVPSFFNNHLFRHCKEEKGYSTQIK